MTGARISIEHAKPDKLISVVVSGVVYMEGRCLILKRDESEAEGPGKWGLPGGKMQWSDFKIRGRRPPNGSILTYNSPIQTVLRREIKEEAGIEVKTGLIYLSDWGLIRHNGIPVLLIRAAVRYGSGKIKLEEGSFTDHAWVNSQQIRRYDCLSGIGDAVAETILLLSR